MMERISHVMRARLDGDTGTGSMSSEEGFTLVELLIVVVVLGILAAVTVFGLSGTTATSYRAACNSDARSVEIAAETYHANNSPNWPANIAALTAADAANNNVVYLRTVPNSPKYSMTLGPTGQVLVSITNGTAAQQNLDYDAGVNGTGAAPDNVNPCTLVP
jgi:general secretion pathway protein G